MAKNIKIISGLILGIGLLFLATAVKAAPEASVGAPEGYECAEDSDCAAPGKCVQSICHSENPYCVTSTPSQESICQPLAEGQTECPKDWQPAKTCPCPNGQGECLPLVNPLQGNNTDIFVLLGTIIRVALGIMGSLTLLMLVWGGFTWLTSAGNPERVKKGTLTMVWAAIGVAAVLASYFVLYNFTQYLTSAQ